MGLLQKLELKTAMDVPYARNPEEPVSAQRIDKLYQKVQVGRPHVFELAYCCYAALYESVQFFSYSKF